MNKILVDNNRISSDDLNVIINKNTIEFKDSGEYFLEYISNGKYNLTFIVNCDVKLIETSYDNELDIDNKYVINSGEFRAFKFYNNKNVNENINIDLCNERAKVDYHFANICKEEEKYILNINHKCKNTFSNIQNKSIALKNSNLKFIINSNVKKDCIGSVLDQNTRIVTMGECDASISPNMFIDLDDISAKHGSIIGSFKDDDIFYLMSKGISYSDTLKLLIKGYIIANMEVDSETRMKIIKIIDTYWR